MKIKIKENVLTRDELKRELSEKFDNKYNLYYRGKYMIVVAKTKILGCTVMIHKNNIHVNGNFSTMKAQIIFTLLVVLLGVIIPLIVYFIVFHKKMKVVEKEVGQFIKENYKAIIIE
jgi:VIT1/CCC1 family predicted Fe2+/Mn2+ transporter